MSVRAKPIALPHVACVVLLTVGCGRGTLDPGASDAGGEGASVFSTATGFCREFEAHVAQYESRCFGDAPADELAAFIAANCDPLDGLVASGGLGYDPKAAAACQAQFDATFATSCNFPSSGCSNIFPTGGVGDGARCTTVVECVVPKSSCARPDPKACDPRVCIGPSKLGAACGRACAAGLICSADKVCVTNMGALGDPCQESSSCNRGLFCSVNPSTMRGTCRETTTGMSCTGDVLCPLGDFCDGTCKHRLRVGDSCLMNQQACVAYAACDSATGRCVAAGGSGQPCGLNRTCFLGVCSSAGTCLSLLPDGALCTDPAECTSGVCNGSCQPCAL